MPAVGNIVLNDAATTPVAHTFVPIDFDAKSGTWWYEDQSGSSSIGFNRISLNLSKPLPASSGASSKGRVIRVKCTVHTPVMETLATNSAGIIPAPTIAYIPRVSIEFILPEQSQLQNRKDIRKFAQFLLADTQVVSMVESLANVY